MCGHATVGTDKIRRMGKVVGLIICRRWLRWTRRYSWFGLQDVGIGSGMVVSPTMGGF